MSQGNTWGRLFRVTTWGESHGKGLGVVVDGCPPRVAISEAEIQRELNRRKPGQSKLTTQRKEADRAEILSGVMNGKTLGTPISIWVQNHDARSSDYIEMREKYRPSHADFTYEMKYGIRAWQGGGRASARETIGRVAAGALARKILGQEGIRVTAYVKRVAHLEAQIDPERVTRAQVEANLIRCPDRRMAKEMIALIDQIRNDGDSVGGVIEAVATGMPVGLGEPVFSRLEADLAAAMLSLPATKGFEIGSGFMGTYWRGSEHNDVFVKRGGRVRTLTNHSGGVQGGISNGEPVIIRVAFKPTATILRSQSTVDRRGRAGQIKAKGRHDPCVLPRAVALVEAMMQLVLVDHWLLNRAQCGGA